MDYTDTVVVVLACVTVIITCAALVIGMLGVFGYEKLKREATDEAIRAALLRIEKEMEKGGIIEKLLVERADQFLADYYRRQVRRDDWGKEESEYGE